MSERLFSLQLTLKKNRVNIQRKYEEVDRLCDSYINQIKNYMFSLFKSFSVIFPLLEPSCESRDVRLPPMPETSVVSSPEISLFFSKVNSQINQIIETNFAGGMRFSESAFHFLMSVFHYFWTKEYCDKFTDLVLSSSQALAPMLCSCFIFQPNTQMYLVNALRPVFEDIGRLSSYELVEIFNQSAIKYSPMLPTFVRKCLKYLDSPAPVFWSLLEPILKNFDVFGLANVESRLFDKGDLAQLIAEFSDFYNGDSSESFVNNLLSCSESVCAIPTIQKISSIIPDYAPFTLVSKDIFELSVEDVVIPKAPANMFFLQTGEMKVREDQVKKENEQYIEVLKKFLLRAALIRVPTEQQTALAYFQALAELSSVYGDPDLEDDLDQIISLLPQDLTIAQVEGKLYNVMKEESVSPEENPLNKISSYSSQQVYLTKMTDYFNQFEIRSKEIKDYNAVVEFMENQTMPTQTDIASFLAAYESFAASFEAKSTSQLRFIFTYLGVKTNLWSSLSASPDTAEFEQKMHSRIAGEGQELANSQKHSFIDPFRSDKSKLAAFEKELCSAVKCLSPLEAAIRLHAAFQCLSGMLTVAGMDEIGADQISPFAIVAIASVNPPGLAAIYKILNDYVSPLFGGKSPLEHAVEYSVVQFLSTIKSFEDYQP